MNRQETTKILMTLASVWSNETIDEPKITAYQWALADVPYPAVEQATRTLLRSAKFFPKPAEILELIADAHIPQVSTGEAWEIVQRQIRAHGHANFDQCDFGNDAILAAVKRVGWRRLCLDEDQRFIRRDFDEALENAQERARKELQAGTKPLEALAAANVTALRRVS